jgi:hypothetical protein
MDEATKNALNEFVQQAISATKAAGQWSAEQAPLLVQEWLSWQLAESAAWMVLALLAVVPCALGLRMLRAKHAECAASKDWSVRLDTLDYNIASALVAIMVAGLVFAAFVNALHAVKVIVAPRVVVVEQLGRWLQ